MQINNRKARFNLTIEEEIEAGMMLLGSEVKSLREGKASISESYITEAKGEIFLINANINEYKGANKFNHEPKRPRKLLLHKSEIIKLKKQNEEKGLTLVALAMYLTKTGFVKVKIGVCRGKKLFDKRASLKEKSENREIARVMKGV